MCANAMCIRLEGRLTAYEPAVCLQEVLKVVSEKAAPLQNFFLFDLSSGDGKVENMKPIPVAA
jgi:hypothetical protein